MSEIKIKCNQIYTKSITLSISTKIKTMIFAGERVIMAYPEESLQTGLFILQNVGKILECKYHQKNLTQ
jgi:hypothetical protein